MNEAIFPKRTGARGSIFRAFTLVEVLIVVAIIGVLSAIITSATIRGVAMAKSSTCVSNLRQINMAAQMYSTANDGYWPPTAMLGVGDGDSEATLFKAEVAPYGASSGIFFCPADPYAGQPHLNEYVFGPEAETSYTECYAFLVAGKQVSKEPVLSFLVQDTQVVDPSACWTLKDSGFPTDLSFPSADKHNYLTGHGKTANFVFVDGHAKSYPTTEASFTPTTSGCLAKGR